MHPNVIEFRKKAYRHTSIAWKWESEEISNNMRFQPQQQGVGWNLAGCNQFWVGGAVCLLAVMRESSQQALHSRLTIADNR